MEWIEAGFTLIAFVSLMYGVICIDEHFQNHRRETKFLNKKEFSYEAEKIFKKEMSR